MPGITHMTLEDLIELDRKNTEEAQEYLRQVKESEGFDVNVVFTEWCGTIVPIPTEIIQDERHPLLLEIKSLCGVAINWFNAIAESHFKVLKVIHANQQLVQGVVYYITFLAREEDAETNAKFQAKVFNLSYGKDPEVEVEFCRIKDA